MNLIRKYKISKLLNKPLQGIEKEIITFIQSWINDLIPFKLNDFYNSIFYMKENGNYVFEYNLKSSHLHVRYYDFWEVLENKYFIKYLDIDVILRFMIEETFKYKIIPQIGWRIAPKSIEDEFKLSSSYTMSSHQLLEKSVKEDDIYLIYIENSFNKKVKIPRQRLQTFFKYLKELFKTKLN